MSAKVVQDINEGLGVPKGRQELLYTFTRTFDEFLTEGEGDDIDGNKFVDILLPRLVDQVPQEAFDAIQPFDEGILFFQGGIDYDTCSDLQHDLYRVHLNLPPGKPILLHFTSYGGHVDAGLSVVSVIHAIQAQGRAVNIHIDSHAASMGSVILQAATKRTASPYATIMVHELGWGSKGKTADQKEELKQAEREEETLLQLYSSRSGKPIDFYKSKIHKTNWYLTAQEALAEGLIDEIIAAPNFPMPALKAEPKKRGKKSA